MLEYDDPVQFANLEYVIQIYLAWTQEDVPTDVIWSWVKKVIKIAIHNKIMHFNL